MSNLKFSKQQSYLVKLIFTESTTNKAFQCFDTWLGGRKGIRPVKNEWWSAGVVIHLEWVADLHTAQLMLLLLTVSYFSNIQIGFTFLVPAHPGSPGKKGR